MEEELSAYERERLENIENNKKKLRELGLLAPQEPEPPEQQQAPKRPKPRKNTEPRRQSGRLKAQNAAGTSAAHAAVAVAPSLSQLEYPKPKRARTERLIGSGPGRIGECHESRDPVNNPVCRQCPCCDRYFKIVAHGDGFSSFDQHILFNQNKGRNSCPFHRNEDGECPISEALRDSIDDYYRTVLNRRWKNVNRLPIRSPSDPGDGDSTDSSANAESRPSWLPFLYRVIRKRNPEWLPPNYWLLVDDV